MSVLFEGKETAFYWYKSLIWAWNSQVPRTFLCWRCLVQLFTSQSIFSAPKTNPHELKTLFLILICSFKALLALILTKSCLYVQFHVCQFCWAQRHYTHVYDQVSSQNRPTLVLNISSATEDTKTVPYWVRCWRLNYKFRQICKNLELPSKLVISCQTCKRPVTWHFQCKKSISVSGIVKKSIKACYKLQFDFKMDIIKW